MSNQNDSDAIAILFIVIVAVAAGLIWKFSQAFNLDFETASTVIMRLVGTLVVIFFVSRVMPFSMIYPLALGALWVAFFPALDYWAASDYTSFGFGRYGELPWWAEWYTKAGVLISLVGLPYLIKKIWSPY